MIKRLLMIITLIVMISVVLTPYANAWTQFNDGGIYDIDYIINDDVWVDYEKSGMGTTVNFQNGGGITGHDYNLKSFENSIININEGRIDNSVYAYDFSHINITNNSIGDFYVYEYSQIDITNNSYINNFHINNNSQVTITNSTIFDLLSNNNSQIKIFDSTIKNILSLRNDSQINIINSSMHEIQAGSSSQINIANSSINNYINTSDNNQLCMVDSTVWGTLLYGNTNIANSVIGDLQTYNNSQTDITNSTINGICMKGNSQINMDSGVIDGFVGLSDDSILTLFGSDFAVDGDPIEYMELTSILCELYHSDPNRTFSGTWASGNTFEFDFKIGDSAKIVLSPSTVPIPASMWLFGSGLLGVIGVAKRKNA